MKRMCYLALILFIFFVLSGSGGCSKKVSKTEERVIPVETAKITRENLAVKFFYVGDIKAQDQVMVYPKITGKLIENRVKEGNNVKKGDIIAYIDRDEIGFEFEKAPVESPIDGIVGNMYLDKGQSVTPDIVVAQIVDMDVVKVRINAVERDLPRIKEGQLTEIKADAYPNEIFEGVVERISPVVDLMSRTALVEIKISNDDHKLKPGMFARINILIEEKGDVLIVPRDAIIRENSSNYVFVVKAANTVHRQKIETGLHENNKFEAVKGLKEGDIVVTLGNTRLNENDKVKITNKE